MNCFFNTILSLIFGCAFLFTSCTRTHAFRDSYLAPYQAGDLVIAEQTLNKALKDSLSQRDFKRNSDSVWMLLDRGTIRFAEGKAEEAIQDYQLAIEAIDYYNQSSTHDTLSQYILQDDQAAYAGDPYEQILARVYFALSLAHSGDYSNAHALLRQAEAIQQRFHGSHDNPLAKYLLALFSERNNDLSNAKILYEQVQGLLDCQVPIPNFKTNDATLIILCHNGNIPRKLSSTCQGTVVSAVLLEQILKASNHKLDPAWSSYTGIPIPVLYQPPFSRPVCLYAAVDKEAKPFTPMLNVAALAEKELKLKTPVIAARALARMIIRRAAIGYVQEQDRNLGALADLGMLLANLNTSADTRSWSTLPSSIDLTRFALPQGVHKIAIKDAAGSFSTDPLEVNLQAQDLCIVHIFNLHPGITTVIIPEKFQNKKPL